jgi:hypothetical protein
MQHDPYRQPVSPWQTIKRGYALFETYTSAVLAVPAIVIGIIMIWAVWGDLFGLLFGLAMIAGGVWMGWETLRAITGRRE